MKEMLPQVKLLPYRYKRYGVIMLVVGIPFMMLLSISLIGLGVVTDTKTFFAEWNNLMVYYPIILGLALLNFSHEKEEDEMVQHLRFQAFMNGVFYLIVGVLMLPVFTKTIGLVLGKFFVSDVGGMLGTLMLLLFYTYVSFRYKLYLARKSLQTDAE